MQIEDLYKLFLQHPSIQIDSRKLKAGEIFFALKGPNFNGNQFAQQALDTGAAYVVVDEKLDFSDERIIKTDDVLSTLQQLAGHHRKQFAIPFIAITGSNGKTTTKELVHAVLSSTYRTYTTEGNLNNHIGIPLTILKIKSDAEMAVIEMGANHLHEIEGYCKYALPTHGLITNCGKAHLEGFGSIEGVRKAKGELFDHIRANHGTVFVNADDSTLVNMATGIEKIISYGKEGMVVGKISISDDPFLKVKIDDTSIKSIDTKLVGAYNYYNVLAAVAIGKHFTVRGEQIKSSIEAYVPSNSRSQLIKKDSNTIILDAYNANPSSMKVAIENFALMQGKNKIMILGGMAELGDESESEHRSLIDLIDKYQWKNVVLVGKAFKDIPNKYFSVDTSADAGEWLKDQDLHDSLILIKGSNSMKMEKVTADL